MPEFIRMVKLSRASLLMLIRDRSFDRGDWEWADDMPTFPETLVTSGKDAD